ncbi:MAG: acyl-CoA dehydrogenase [Gemmatimonadota bacterium]
MIQPLSRLAEAEERREVVRDAARKFLTGEWSLARLRRSVEGDGVADAPALLRAMRALGGDDVASFGAETHHALPVAEFCTVMEETGYALAPTALLASVVGRMLLRDTGTGLSGSLPVLAHAEAERTTDPNRTTVTAVSTSSGHRLHGSKQFVPYGMQADVLVLDAVQDDGTLALFVVAPTAPEVTRTPLELLDFSPCAEVELCGVHVDASARLAAGETAARLLSDALDLETLGRCAELVGVGARVLDLAVEYAKQRVAFDRPIGSFQAVQHKLVDLRGDVEVARALHQAAADAGSARHERRAAVSMAAFAALDGLRRVPEGALQIFGGIGTTWEHDIHFFVRRAATLCSFLGERSAHRETIAGHLAARGRRP